MIAPAPRRGRPPVSTREALEEIAFELLLRDGYEATTVQAILAAGGVSRTTFFRYFGSKGAIVWGEFDRAIERLRADLDAAGDLPVVAAVIHAVTESTRLSRDAAPETWLDRFRVLDRDPALVGEAAAHWRAWGSEITAFIERRTGLATGAVASEAVGGAIQAAYVAVLRQWSVLADSSSVDPSDLRAELERLEPSLRSMIEAARPTSR